MMSPVGAEAPDVPIFYPGMRLDRYELLCPLAQGGMGAVWLARYTGKFGFTRLVVVKVMLPQYAREEKMRAMFIDEARIAASIDHPNVVSTLDVGEEEGLLFLAMNWVDGDSLSRLMAEVTEQRRRLPAGVALKIAADVCAGLHAAHELRDENGELRGLVHRDVSPQNVLLATNGRAMLIDFGIAKANKRISEETSVGRIKGKLSYMSPEQARTAAVDRRADLFSVGAMLYEVFAGAPPFERQSDIQTLTRLTRGGPAGPLPRGTPPAVQNVVMRALALEPAQRYQTAEEMGHELVLAMREIGEPTTDQEVARYAEDFLAERRKQRARAVQNALFAADDTVAARATRMEPRRTAVGSADPRGDHMKATLEFDASPFASALGPYATHRVGPAPVPPPSSSADLSAYASSSSSYSIAALSGQLPVQPAGSQPPPPRRAGDPIHELQVLWASMRRSELAQTIAMHLERANIRPAMLAMVSVSVLVAVLAIVAVVRATRDTHPTDEPTSQVAPLPTMAIPTTPLPIPKPASGPLPLVQQGTATPTPTWSPTPSPPAPGTATATSTSFSIPAPTVKKRGRSKPIDPDGP